MTIRIQIIMMKQDDVLYVHKYDIDRLTAEWQVEKLIFQGNAVSRGYAVGEVLRYVPFKAVVTENQIEKGDVEDSIRLYESILEAGRMELSAIMESMSYDPDKMKIFQAHIDILDDIAINEDIRDHIQNDLYSPEYALDIVYDKYIRILSRAKDELIRERVADLLDVKNRLLRIYFKVPNTNLSNLGKPVIIVANDLFPSDTATMDRENVLAILTEIGGITSHTAILAKSYEIPAILGISNIMQTLKPGEKVIVDAVSGWVITEATQAQLDEYAAKQEAFEFEKEQNAKYLGIEPFTSDNIRIDVTLNIGSAQEHDLAFTDVTDGVGLFRTEFLYMKGNALPTEDEQYEVYKKVLEAYGDKPVIIRTLDVGGDKKLECIEMPTEDNPFLGLRALRLCFDQMHIFKEQLRALYRASVHGNLWIMFPMVGSIGDIRFAKRVLEEVKHELISEGYSYSDNVKIGIMIEIPSIAIMADVAAAEVDFASIGTNDLCQYLTAVDRLNPKVADYYQSYHPAMFRVIKNVIAAFSAQGKPVSICGELGGEPLATVILIGLGLRKLSMNSSSLAEVKKKITETNIFKAERMANTVLGLSTAGQVENFLKSEMNIVK